VHGADLSVGGTRIYVQGHIHDGSHGHCEIWSIEVATQRYVGPVIDIGPCPPEGTTTVAAAAVGSRVALTYAGPDGDATDIHDGRTSEKLARPSFGN
jgi:hypothetical protein